MECVSRNAHINMMTGSICEKMDELIPTHLKNILMRASQGRSSEWDNQQRNDTETQSGESKIRKSINVRDENITHWIHNLKDEINRLNDDHITLQKHIDESLKTYCNFRSILGASEMCKNYRKVLECADPHDEVNQMLDKELSIAENVMKNTYDCIKKLREFLARLEDANTNLRCEMKAKIVGNVRVKACAQSKPLMSEPYLPEEVMHPYEDVPKLEWERKVRHLILLSMNLRHEGKDYRVYTLDTIEKHTSELAAAWTKTNFAFNDEISKDEIRLDFIHKVVTRMDKEINGSRLRMSIFHNEYERQNLQKTLDTWRLQRLNSRPKTENIQDSPVVDLEDELLEIQRRMNNAIVDFKSDRELFKQMENMRCEQSRKIDVLVKRLFANRENCRGLRRSITIDGLKQEELSGDNKFYVS